MCFSAEASFSAGVICSLVGVASIKHSEKKDLLIAAIPLLFGLQQIMEGFVWFFEGNNIGYLSGIIFIGMAFCLWTIYIPIATIVTGIPKLRKNIILGLLLVGILLSVYGLFVLSFPLEINLSANQIQYIPSQKSPLILEYLYAMVVLIPLWLMKNITLRLFAIIILIFFIISTLFFNPARFSVWCFFAAVSSVLIYLYVSKKDLKILTTLNWN